MREAGQRSATGTPDSWTRSPRRYGEDAPAEPDRLHSELFSGTRTGGIGLLRDLQDLYLMAAECDICWTVVGQAAHGARDDDLLAVVKSLRGRDGHPAEVAAYPDEAGRPAGAGGGTVSPPSRGAADVVDHEAAGRQGRHPAQVQGQILRGHLVAHRPASMPTACFISSMVIHSPAQR